MKSLRTVDAVHTHTHTHTQANLEKQKNESTISTLLSIYVRDG